MDLYFSAEDENFRAEAREWLTHALEGEFAGVRGRGGPGDEHALFEERLAWERALGAAGWTCLSWPAEYGGRDVTLLQQVIFYEEYARAGGPGRVGIVGEGLIGPTILHFGTDEQKRRFLPKIASGEELWCQGYSEPNAGSDLANIATRAELEDGPSGEEWVVSGQKVWTSLAHWAQLVLRAGAHRPRRAPPPRHLLPPRADGPAGRRDPADRPDHRRLRVQRGVLRRRAHAGGSHRRRGQRRLAASRWARSRSSVARSTLGQQLGFANEWREILARVRDLGHASDPVLRQRLAQAWIELEIMRYNALRGLTAMAKGEVTRETSISKLFWGSMHRRLGELAMDVARAVRGDRRRRAVRSDAFQRLFLYSRADTIYGGSNEIQRNVIGERVLGLPAEPKVV